jgi:hypothetical protein
MTAKLQYILLFPLLHHGQLREWTEAHKMHDMHCLTYHICWQKWLVELRISFSCVRFSRLRCNNQRLVLHTLVKYAVGSEVVAWFDESKLLFPLLSVYVCSVVPKHFDVGKHWNYKETAQHSHNIFNIHGFVHRSIIQ